jgi:hypothetical protein
MWAVLAVAMSIVAGSPGCELGEGPERLGPLLEGASEEARAVLDHQIAGYWLNDGWDMGVAPGPLTAETARTAIASASPHASRPRTPST